MAAQALYRKWRSQNFDELIGQDHIVRTLRNGLREERTAQAYLFTGPRGTGKTSTARILAKAVNCEAALEQRPCNQCRFCVAINEDRLLDLIEIDAASHTGVDNMRETVIDRVNFRPTDARYKIYIIDEVHMLSTSSFNALLKTLEEPPPHVIFILATTDVQKVPATVLSRCQRFDFHRIPAREMVAHLREICGAEQRVAEPEALLAISRHAAGCMRDAISLLDQLMAYGNETITLRQVENMLGTVPTHAIAQLADALASQNVAAGLAVVGELAATGVELRELARQTVDYLRNLLLIQMGGSQALTDLPAEVLQELTAQSQRFEMNALLKAIRLFNQAAVDLRGNFQAIPQLSLELAVVDAARADSFGAEVAASKPVKAVEFSAPPVPPKVDVPVATNAKQVQTATASVPPVSSVVEISRSAAGQNPTDKIELLRQRWPQIKEQLQGRRRMLLGILTGGVRFLAVQGDEVVIGYDASKVQAQYNARRLLEAENKTTLETVLSDALGAAYRVRVVPEDQFSPSEIDSASEISVAAPEIGPDDPLLQFATQELGAVVRDSD